MGHQWYIIAFAPGLSAPIEQIEPEMTELFANISIDLDGIACYHAIHGLDRPDAEDPVYSTALQRFLDLLAELDLRATLFAVGRDLQRSGAGPLLRAAVQSGHEIANHTFSHDYRLIQLSREQIAAEIGRCHDSIERLVGVEPCGFRAPGYNISEAVLDALEARHYSYDASVFPAPLYFAARAAAIGLYAVRGQPSRSLIGDARQFLGPRAPYRPRVGQLHKRGSAGQARNLVEFPVAVVPAMRLPFIGTTLTLLPDAAGQLLTQGALLRRTPVCLELHGVDFLDQSDRGVSATLAARQRDLQVSAIDKIRRLRSALQSMARRRACLTLRELARTL